MSLVGQTLKASVSSNYILKKNYRNTCMLASLWKTIYSVLQGYIIGP